MEAPSLISVFISYSNKDRAWRDQIAASLQRADLNVLDDTLLIPGEKWAVELQGMRERAHVALLIVTQNFLASTTIQAEELPRLLKLQGNGIRLIPVIAEPCDWQKLTAISSIQAFPQFGRPLASDPGNIAEQLDELAQMIHQLVSDVNAPPEPRSPSQSQTSSQLPPSPPSNTAPSSGPSRLSPSDSSLGSLAAPELALRLFVKSTGYAAMASLVSPTLAVTSYHVLRQSGLLENRDLPIMIEGSPRARISTTASVIAAVESANIALLRLSAGVYTSLIGPEVPLTTVMPAGRWHSYCMPAASKVWLPVTGQLGGPYKIENHEYQTLGLDPPIPPGAGGVSGAPVIWNEQLIGIVALASQDGSSWYATLITQQLVDELANSSSTHHKPSDWLTKEDIESFSPAAREVIDRADQLRRNRKLSGVTIGVLVASLAQQEGGQLRVLLKDMNSDLNEIAPTDDPRNTLVDIIEESGLPPISRNVRRVLIGARDKAKALGSKTIDESHILFAALEIPDHPIIEALKKRKITSDKVKFDAVQEPAPRNDLLAGVQSDTPAGEDLLDITPEVNALASVLAAKDADPPLALGLFGEWGSGKSFFMGRLEGRIRALQDDAQEARKDGVESSYCEHIVQLTFNAWNYIDTNLWASLATQIFEGLASAVAKRRGGDSQEERALVLAAASSSQEVLAETERKKSAAEEELKQTQQQLTILQNSQNNIEASLSPSELFKQAYRFAIAQDEVKKPMEQVAEQLKIREGTTATGEIKAEILELRGFWTTLLFTLRHGQNLWIWLLVFAAMLCLGWGVSAWLKNSGLPDAAKHAIAMLTAFSGFLGTFRVWARKALTLVQAAQSSKQQLIEQKKQEKTATLEMQYKEVQEKVKKASEAVASASQTVNQINRQLENMRADRQMADYIRQRNESTDYTQHLGIIARVRTDFQHLSTLLQDVRDESEQEVLEMKKRQKDKEAERQKAKQAERKIEAISGETSAGAEKDEQGDKEDDKLFPRIDRIILYIDDLDRCPEKNVVEVLQAVHLLLAFPLFIVVVGVDPRWLLRSLETQTAVFRRSAEQNNSKGKQDDDPLWQSTPMNYLEKIFQIPFTLRPINKTGFGNLVDKFAAATKEKSDQAKAPESQVASPTVGATPAATPPPLSAMATAAAAGVSPAIQTSATAIGQVPAVSTQSGSQGARAVLQPVNAAAAQSPSNAITVNKGPAAIPIDRNPAHLQIEGWERAFMKELHELIPSPRAGKRFINIYRLLRASVKDSERKKFIGSANGGDYQAVQILLAILTGYPAEATEILQKLIEGKHPETWGQFIEALKKETQAEPIALGERKAGKSRGSSRRTADTRPAAANIANITIDNTPPQNLLWVELFDKLDRLKINPKSMSCTPFCDWAVEIARYSFQSGRVMLYQRD
jgi:KAP family P-loop domain/TIR domain/Clp amino terminal domain, pathogenicity island component